MGLILWKHGLRARWLWCSDSWSEVRVTWCHHPCGRDYKKATDVSEQPLLGQILTPNLNLSHKYPFLYL